ncbi:putative E3 ubiquitin-protein ligase LIN-2 isoform X2 [Diospyros lotus]|uniref:putative E3 ubiquitin-protein ligase LIN-2 isoform X2 n=1 Tax=Diospyros lotus TaxID=55363 RepID=UPI00225C2906|nr:putative E3 ubiquitin-protein ligase LIN-2 isoform X2 [Diospyros lotus]
MAMSLEELLAEEGFREGRSKVLERASSSGSRAVSMPLYPYRDRHKSGSSSGVKRTDRIKSDIPRHGLRNELPSTDKSKGRISLDIIRRQKIDRGLKEKTEEKFERVSNNPLDVKHTAADSPQDFLFDEIVEVGDHSGQMYRDIYSNEIYSPQTSKDKYSDVYGERERHKRKPRKNVDKRHNNNSNNSLPGHSNSSGNQRERMKQQKTSYRQSNISSRNSKLFHDNTSQRHSVEQNVTEPALDEVAVQAMISILTGYIKSFLTDEDFRTSLRHNCFASLNFVEDGRLSESKVIINLEHAIETVERSAEECANAKELKKASLQLSVITGLNSNDLKDGFTSVTPNSKLSACAHLYLSVIYKLQKNDRIAAKHLLQVFCDSPFQARTMLLPELWDCMIFPHLSHLKDWYNHEANCLASASRKTRKLKFLEKVYNEIMDSGTYQFAVYYKDWLTEGIEAPCIPSIHVPSTSFGGVQRRLSYSIQGAQHERVDEVEDYKGSEKFEYSMRSSDSSAVEDKQALTFSSTIATRTDQDIEQDDASHPEDGLIDEKVWRLLKPRAPAEGEVCEKFGDSPLFPADPDNTQILHQLPHYKANDFYLKSPEKSVFKQKQTEGPLNHMVSSFSWQISLRGSGLQHDYENFNNESSLSSIPKDFICPLTGFLFEDPVTLETGQTFERAAITEWFEQGNETCPVTGKTLECQSLPLTNFILKRVINNWKSEQCRHLLAFASQAAREHRSKLQDETAVFKLHQLYTAFSKRERITNGKHLISVGGLQFLTQRFELGNLEERACVASLFSLCIEAENGCRNYIAQNIKKSCLLELIQSKDVDVRSRANAVLLLVELICLSRKKDVHTFVSGLQYGKLPETMDALLVYLQSSPPEQRPLVAVLLLHIDLLVRPEQYTMYRSEAVDAVAMALDDSLSNEKVQTNCCRALLILVGRFSPSGKIMTEDWILKEDGFVHGPDPNYFENEEHVLAHEIIPLDDEEEEKEEWLRSLSASFICDGKKSFLDSIYKCLGDGNLDLVRVCLVTMAWLSSALAAFPSFEFQLSAFSAVISRLKEILENSELVEHKILASMSLFSFSKIPECRLLLMKTAKEITVPLKSLAEVTWTARELYSMISMEDS